VLGVLLLVASEIMFFGGLASAFVIARAGAAAWPPPGQPRLPVEVTALNTAILLASGVLLWLAGRRGRAGVAPHPTLTAWAGALGALFVGLQGVEWMRLVGFGLTLTSGAYGGFFYVIVGAHALHAVAGLAALAWVGAGAAAGRAGRDAFRALQVYWSFVVALWPVLYVLVYLA
jgi:heme/copper-type cytochrome/quinol oxidase subunit 3